MDDRVLLGGVVGAHGSNSSLSTVQTLTTPGGAGRILVQALTQNIRFTMDGTAPTASLGFQLKAGDPMLMIPITPGMQLKFIQESATATLQYQYFG